MQDALLNQFPGNACHFRFALSASIIPAKPIPDFRIELLLMLVEKMFLLRRRQYGQNHIRRSNIDFIDNRIIVPAAIGNCIDPCNLQLFIILIEKSLDRKSVV